MTREQHVLLLGHLAARAGGLLNALDPDDADCVFGVAMGMRGEAEEVDEPRLKAILHRFALAQDRISDLFWLMSCIEIQLMELDLELPELTESERDANDEKVQGDILPGWDFESVLAQLRGGAA